MVVKKITDWDELEKSEKEEGISEAKETTFELKNKEIVISYFQQRLGQEIDKKQLTKEIPMKSNSLNSMLYILKKEQKIESVGRGKYRMPKEVDAESMSEQSSIDSPKETDKKYSKPKKSEKSLKVLYTYEQYQKIIDYIYTRSEISEGNLMNQFEKEELVHVIKLSIERGFVKEIRRAKEGSKYAVKDIAKVWYRVLIAEGKPVNMIMNMMVELNDNQKGEALKQAVKEHFIAMNKAGCLYVVS